MATCGRKAWAALVWLTTLMTLVAGLPHFDCRCPSGQVKPFCPGQTSTACCCGGSCCSPTQPPPPQDAPDGLCPRCGHHPDTRGDAVGTEGAVGSACCLMTLAEAPVLAAGEARAAAEREPDAEPLAPPSHGGFPAAHDVQASAWQPGTSPPPIDLVILLRHLVI